MSDHPLAKRMGALRSRAWMIHAITGGCWGLLTAVAVLVGMAWIDLAVDFPAGLRVGAWVLAITVAIVPLARWISHSVAAGKSDVLARVIDTVARAQGQVHAGVDLLLHPTPAAATPSATGDIFRHLAIERASRLARVVPASEVVPVAPVSRAVFSLGATFLALACFALIAPRLASTEVLRFMDPYGDHPPWSSLQFAVDPGNAKVLYGGNLPIKVHVSGGNPDRLDLVVLSDDLHTSDSLPMFSQSTSAWQTAVTNVTTPGWYIVKSGSARSQRFRLDVITVPKIENARVHIQLPAYTNRPGYDGPIPPQGISGLAGTRVNFTVKSNRPLRGGNVQITADGKSTTIHLTPVPTEPTQAAGTFILASSGRLTANVTDVDGQASTEPLNANLTVTADQKPFVRLLQPLSQSFATPTVDLPVEVSAEDDYGIGKLQVFRGINDSRPLPKDLNVPAPAPTLLPATMNLPLSAYGVKPGDTIKLFAHVEDTDPAGPKGSDSPVVIVTIISEQEMQQLILARQTMETLQSKYEQANRRLEALDKEMEKLQKDLQGEDKPLTDAQQKELDKLSKDIGDQEAATRDAGKQDLPFDLDKALRKHLDEVADKMEEAKNDAKQLAAKPGLHTAGARGRLDELRKKLQSKQKDFAEQATDPIQRLADIFPLQEDQARFEELYEMQRDLEGRLYSIREANGEDNPQLKGRMRDYEDEQRVLRQDLQKLLDDIDTHVAQLPEDPALKKLHDTAQKFSKEVRESTAVEEMASGESGLAGFSGLLGHAGAKRAADILEQFLSKCNAMNGEACNCLAFNPHLASELGNTIEQMLKAEGYGSKPGEGSGRGGYSMRRSSLQNVGLYGRLPDRALLSKLGGSRADHGMGGNSPGGGNPGGNDVVDAHTRQRAAGASDAAIPQQYRQQVGDYFQRVADDMGDQNGK